VLGMTTEVHHPLFEDHPRMTALVGFSRSTTRAEAGVLIGQQTDDVLRELGVTEEELTDLADRKIIRRG